MKITASAEFILRKKNLLIEIISSVFILLFVYTALSKLTDFKFFIAQLHTHPGIKSFANTIGWIVPTTELIISSALFIPRMRIIGLYGSLTLMSIFTVYLGYMLRFGEILPCSCGGVLKYMSWEQHIVFNSFFILLAIFGIWLSKNVPVGNKPGSLSFNRPST